VVMQPIVFGICFGITGACWMMVVANNNTSMQMILPHFMRARGMAINQMVFFGALVLGAMLWGKTADQWSARTALIIASLSLLPLTALAASIRLPRAPTPRT